MLEINQLLNLSIKRENRRELYFIIKYIHHQCGIHLKKVKPLNFRFYHQTPPPKARGTWVISENVNSNSTVIDCLTNVNYLTNKFKMTYYSKHISWL